MCVTGGRLEKCVQEEFHILHSLPSFIGLINSRRVNWVGRIVILSRNEVCVHNYVQKTWRRGLFGVPCCRWTYSIEQVLLGKLIVYQIFKKFPIFCLNLKVLHCVHKILSSVLILSEINPVKAFKTDLTSPLILFSHPNRRERKDNIKIDKENRVWRCGLDLCCLKLVKMADCCDTPMQFQFLAKNGNFLQ